MAQFGVGYPTLRRWLDQAGIQVRPRGSGGYVRQLSAPTARELAELGRGLSVPAIAKKLAVSDSTVRRWFDEAGLTPPATTTKNRPRGASTAVQRPAADRLQQLYVSEGLSIASVANRVGFTPHLVRMWLLEDGTTMRAPGGRRGASRPGRVYKPAPPTDELRRLRELNRLSRSELATRYGVHPQTVSKWLADAGMPGRLSPTGPVVSDGDIAAMYRAEPIAASEIARRLGVADKRVLAALHREGVELDPARQAAAVRAASARRRGTVPPLPAGQGDQVARLYRDQGWSYQRIASHLGVSVGKVRAELQRRAIPAHTHMPTGPASRAARTQAPVEDLRKLYVESEWSAQDVAAQLDSTVPVVLRTGHAHGVPIRQGGTNHGVQTAVAVIDALYSDEQVSAVLDRHAVPRRPASGDIAARFPDPVPLSWQLLVDLYEEAGCSSNQIELLTGQAQVVVRDTMHRLGIALRPEGMSPALLRLRAAARLSFLAQIAAEYQACGSTAEVARLHNCSTTAVRRWLTLAGVAVPGRGRWTRVSK